MSGNGEMVAALDTIKAAAQDLAKESGRGKGLELARKLMPAFYEVGLRARLDPVFRDSRQLRDVVTQTAPLLDQGMLSLIRWMLVLRGRVMDTFEWEWTEACIARSSWAFMVELYQDTLLNDLRDRVAMEDVDDLLRQLGEFEGFIPDEAVPKGIPASHWWWWAPDAPPAYRA